MYNSTVIPLVSLDATTISFITFFFDKDDNLSSPHGKQGSSKKTLTQNFFKDMLDGYLRLITHFECHSRYNLNLRV